MNDPVRSYFPKFNAGLEGVIQWPYLDTKGLLSVAIGRQIMSEADMLSLPWEINGAPATREQILTDHRIMLAEVPAQMARPPKLKANAEFYRPRTRIRLSADGILQITLSLYDVNQRLIMARVPGFSAWPADARLAVHSMVWAAGVSGVFGGPTKKGFPRFLSWARATPPNFLGCANECDLDTSEDPNIWRRNARQRALFRNAAAVQATPGMDRGVLHFPAQLHSIKEERSGWEPAKSFTI